MKNVSIILGLFVLISCGSENKSTSKSEKTKYTEEIKLNEINDVSEIPSIDNKHHKGDSAKKKTAPPPPVPPLPYDPFDPIEPFLGGEPEEYIEEIIQMEDTNEVLAFAEEMPEFQGGLAEMNAFITKNLQYPEIAKEMALEGKVYLRFTVLKDGSLAEIKVMRGVHASLDKEAIRVIKIMPNWKPARQNSKPVNCYMTIPIKFTLD